LTLRTRLPRLASPSRTSAVAVIVVVVVVSRLRSLGFESRLLSLLFLLCGHPAFLQPTFQLRFFLLFVAVVVLVVAVHRVELGPSLA